MDVVFPFLLNTFRDHEFDSLERGEHQHRRKRTEVAKPGEPERCSQPIRAKGHYKADESKLLPTTRLGIDMQDL